RELRTARAVADRPDAWCRRCQPFVHLHIPWGRECDAGLVEADAVGIRFPSSRDQEVRAFEISHARSSFYRYAHLLSRVANDTLNGSIQQHLDSLSLKQIEQSRADIRVLAPGELRPMLDDRHA